MDYIFISIAFVAGFAVAFILRTITIAALKKENKSLKGLLESERLIKDTMQKEHSFLQRTAAANFLDTKEKLMKAEALILQMDNDILLLQKSNEETEALLAKGEPALYELKMKLIEANNTLARFKAQHTAPSLRSLKQTP